MEFIESGLVLRCEWCTLPCKGDRTACEACGGPIRILEPWVLQCGWCGSSNRRDLHQNCTSCGGALASIPGAQPGPAPPLAPRKLPKVYRWRVLLWKNVTLLAGLYCTFLGSYLFFKTGDSFSLFWFLFSPITGIPLAILGIRSAIRKLYALEHGVATKGEIISIHEDIFKRMNRKCPLVIKYRFETHDGSHTGSTEVWDRIHLKRPQGEHLWIVYDPQNLKAHNIWPPLH